MKLSAILILALAINCGYSYVLEPSLSWPTEYHFRAEEINLVSGIVKPFEIWYSEQYNRSRIDLYGGTIKRYYYAPIHSEDNYRRGKIYMIHPETDENEDTVIRCDQEPHWDDQRDFLPSLYEFEYKGEEDHNGQEVQVWTKVSSYGPMKEEETLYVLEDDEVGIPIQHITQSFTLSNGALRDHSVINYYNYDSNVKFEDLEVEHNDCHGWGRSEDLDAVFKRLHPGVPSDVNSAFRRYKNHHKRDYDGDEHKIRKSIFKENWKLVKEHNSKNLGYTLAMNKYADRTENELHFLANSDIKGPFKQGTHPFPHTKEEIEEIATKLPQDFDLRDEGVITAIQNQANCGSCWAFAATATVEGAYARLNGGRLLDLSEQSLVDCAWAFSSHGCQGTESLDAVLSYVHKNGIPTVQEYGPYLEEDGICSIKNMTNTYGIKGFVAVTPMSTNALKAAVYKYGPVMIGVQVTNTMALYNNGILYDLRCSPGRMNHAVTLVGYGYRDGDLYWIVKNSWGEDWGESGYILMAAQDNNCNVMTCPFYTIV